MYQNLTMNLAVNKNRPDFLLAGVSQPLTSEQSAWWASMTTTEQSYLLLGIQQDIGLDTQIGFSVTEVQFGNTRTRILSIEKRIPIDQSLSRPRFLADIESVNRYFKAVDARFKQLFAERSAQTDG
jgi:hypothetical protein